MSVGRPSDDVLETAAAASPLLVATDFDGVLAPFDPDPMRAVPLPGTIDTLRSLASLPGVHVAVVSGRDLKTLRTLTGIRADEPIVKEQHPQAGIEYKTAAVVVHTRGLPKGIADAAVADARRVALDHEGVKVLKGKSVLELSVSHADKGSAVTAYGRQVGAAARIYLGDDVTDEDVFFRMRRPEDVTVKVGTGSTAARYRLDDEPTVARFLRTLWELCSAAHVPS
jgi:trehalose 6-phosphate phosphatase